MSAANTTKPETLRYVRSGFSTYDLGGWIHEIDTGEDMMKCPDCGGRIIEKHYLLAVGTLGTRFCPYCGAFRQAWNTPEIDALIPHHQTKPTNPRTPRQ